MFSRFSVKRPYVVLVAVIIAMLLGGVSISRMQTNLLPEMEMPYLAVITTEPGASPEKVETDVTEPLEAALGVVSGVESVTSTSSENFSMVFLQFAEDTNMDSAMVKVSAALNTAASTLPEGAGTPNIMEISMDSMATTYSAVSFEGKDIYATSEFVESTVIPYLERQAGIASVSSTGMVTSSVEVRLNQSKIDDVNNRILGNVNSSLYDAKKEIDDGSSALADAQAQLSSQQDALASTQSSTASQLGQGESGLTLAISASMAKIATLQAQAGSLQAALEQAAALVSEDALKGKTEAEIAAIQAQVATQTATVQQQLQDIATQLAAEQAALTTYQQQLAQVQAGGINAAAQFGSASAQMAAAQTTIDQSKAQLESAEEQYNTARESAISSANVDQLVTKDTLSNMIMAQDFSMPAGYVDDANDSQWMVRVGENYDSVEDFNDIVLLNVENVGDIRLTDVADITVVDDAAESYAKVNGDPGVVLSVFKTSTASTSEVSAAINNAIAELEEDNPGLRIDNLMDQGEYISQYISTILTSILLGAILAVVVLAVFLKGIKPTLVVAFSIPFSVLVALLVMYFCNLSLNIMTLGALSLAIGMLVDNSVVVLENIYRLRARGLSAPRASVQGAKQVAGAIFSSTLTTICVFLPLVFTTGLTRQMMLPFALTITFSLLASLLVALTVVPSLSSVIFKKAEIKEHRWFVQLQEGYGRLLAQFLQHKALPLVVAVGLLGFSDFMLFRMGITLIPEMTSKQVSATLTLPDGTDDATSFAKADEVMAAMQQVEGVDFVGIMDAGEATSIMGTGSQADQSHLEYLIYAIPNASITTDPQIKDLSSRLEASLANVGDCEVELSSSMGDVSSMLGSGLQVDIEGEDIDVINDISKQVMEKVNATEGYTEVSNGQEEGDPEISILVDKNAAMRLGITVAQIYTDLADRLSTSAKATSMTLDGTEMDVTIVDETHELTKESLLSMTFDVEKTDGSGNQTTETHALSEVATTAEREGYESITRSDGAHQMQVTAEVEDGYNNALLARDLQTQLDTLEVPEGYTVSMGGEIDNINTVIEQMLLMILLGFVLIYLVMVAQFQSLLSPLIIILTVPLAFTGGMLALLIAGEQITLMSGMGFVVLMGTVVNNGIVFVDYVNQLRLGGMEKRDALVATGKTRMRPIFMTALTTILAMSAMIFSQDIGASMQSGMALVVAGGLLYATLMTLFVVPIMYDLLYRKKPSLVDLGDESIDDTPDDAAEFIEQLRLQAEAKAHVDVEANADAEAEAEDNTQTETEGIPEPELAGELETEELPELPEGEEPEKKDA